MTTLIVNGARQIGTNLIQAAGQYAQSYAVQSVASLFDNRQFEGPRLDSFHIQTSRDGAPMPRVFGRARLAGQVIWSSQVLETATDERVGGKGGPTQTNFSYTVSFAVGLCEGEILSVGRIWANGAILPLSNVTMRIHKGGEEQLPDPIIQAIDGPHVPAFRGTAYVVFEDFPLDEYGGRLPQLSFEVQRLAVRQDESPRLEDLVQSVCLLPSSGEFAYASDLVDDQLGAGQSFKINGNNLSGQSDIDLALDQLENQLPACRHVSIIISWFGTDLRMEECQLRPGVEQDVRNTNPLVWSVGGINRADAYKVSRDESDRPVFGGTPSDVSILQAISSLKSRGFSVTIYPFILMDIDASNTRPDPYSDVNSQPVFPWRGRITCHPAPGRIGTVDRTMSTQTSVNSFMGTADISDFNVTDNQVLMPKDEYGFRRFILHYAHLAKLSGGVDNFLIGSELRGLTQVRDQNDDFPFVEALAELAEDVRTILGNSTAITYAADWSEYFGYHPQDGSGDVFFHLDNLWSHPAISAVGIDSYIPLSDWRDGEHIDAQNYDDEYGLDYLQSNILGGEGYDWFYASSDDRDQQVRTPISDGLNNEPWVFRYKDMENWWANEHYNRKGGVVASNPTSWRPQSKPIWLTELGCPAIDKGSNQPNVFVDPKSSESFTPYFSNGNRDDLIQRRYIEAYLSFWSETGGQNPISSVYNKPMIDLTRSSVWTWDARPFPDFPSRNDVWADGENWRLGHWLTGRTGLVPLSDVVNQLVADAGVDNIDVTRVSGLVEGYVIDRPMTARAALQPLSLLYGFNLVEKANALCFISHGFEVVTDLESYDIVDGDQSAPRLTRTNSESDLLDVRLQYIDGAQDYQLASFSLRNQLAETVRVLDISVPMILSRPMVSWAAERLLENSIVNREAMSFALSAHRIDLEVGDIVRLPDDETLWRIESVRMEQSQYDVRTIRVPPRRRIELSGSFPETLQTVPQTPRPFPVVLDLPNVENMFREAGEVSGALVGARLIPFSPVDISIDNASVNLTRSTQMGVLSSVLKSGPVGRIDYGNKLDVTLLEGVLSSTDDEFFLNGGNLFAIETEQGWEILSAQNAELVGHRTYRLSKLMRGLSGTDVDMVDNVPAGSRVVHLSGPQAIGEGLQRLNISNEYIESDITVNASSRFRESLPKNFYYRARHLRPLSPVHGKYDPSIRRVSWIRRTRIDGDKWTGLDVPLGEAEELYEVAMFDNEQLIETIIAQEPQYDLPASLAEQVTHITVAQGSNLYGFGPHLLIPLS